MKKTAALIVLAFAAGCGDAPAPADATKPAEAPKPAGPAKPAKPQLAPELSDASKKEMAACFAAAREKIKQAREFKAQGDLLVKTQGIAGANDVFVKARDLYKAALYDTEVWVEPDLGKVTAAQVKDHLGSYTSERATWTTENAAMGKLHKD